MPEYSEQQTYEIAQIVLNAHRLIRIYDLVKTEAAIERQNDADMKWAMQAILSAQGAAVNVGTLSSLEALMADGIAEIATKPFARDTVTGLIRYQNIPAVKQVAEELYQAIPSLRPTDTSK